MAVIGYNTAITGIESIDQVYKAFALIIYGKKNAWALQQKILNNNYPSIVFPFDEIKAPVFEINMQWNYYDYLAYLNTWYDKQSIICVRF